MKDELADKLVKKYPTLFKNYKGDMRQTCMAWGICTGDGWYDLLDELCSKLEPYGVVAAQIKEKFGGLRFYLEATPSEKWEEIHNYINEAEAKSYKICEQCGKPGKIRGGFWVRTLCDECDKKE